MYRPEERKLHPQLRLGREDELLCPAFSTDDAQIVGFSTIGYILLVGYISILGYKQNQTTFSMSCMLSYGLEACRHRPFETRVITFIDVDSGTRVLRGPYGVRNIRMKN